MIFTKKTIAIILVTVLFYLLSANTPKGLTQDSIPSLIKQTVKTAAPFRDFSAGKSTKECNIIGHSSRGAVIYDVVITPPHYDKTLLLTFAVHGFEGIWYDDGASLVQIANDVTREFSSHPEELQKTRLIVVPCVNPDGVWYGQNDNGFGRCNGQGIDINRDFDYYWKYSSTSRYRTGNTPFATPEARALRDLVLKEKPDAVIDFHGWYNCTYGDKDLASSFDKVFNMKHQNPVSKDKIYMQQYFAGWASQFARTAIVEYPNPANPQNAINWGYSSKTIYAVQTLCKHL